MKALLALPIVLACAACATGGDAPPAVPPVSPSAAPVKLDVTAELMPGEDCRAGGPAQFKANEPFKVSLCLSTTLEAFCGSTVKFAPESAAQSGHFEIRAIAHNAKLDDPNAKVPFPWAIVTPVPTLDLGSTGGNDGLEAGRRVRFATYTLAATSRANADRYVLKLSADSSLGLRKGGTCGNAYEAPIAASLNLVRQP